MAEYPWENDDLTTKNGFLNHGIFLAGKAKLEATYLQSPCGGTGNHKGFVGCTNRLLIGYSWYTGITH